MVVLLTLSRKMRTGSPMHPLVAGRLFRLSYVRFRNRDLATMACPAIAGHGFGEELIAILREGFDVDTRCLDRPKSSPAGCIAQIHRLVGRTDKTALARLEYFQTSVRGAICSPCG